jgi:hypothetical protein
MVFGANGPEKLGATAKIQSVRESLGLKNGYLLGF